MSAICWGCTFGIAPVGVEDADLLLDPVGTCWECHVFGCPGHAERDRYTGKFMCFPSVAKALGVSAGLEPEEEEALPRMERGDVERRFPRLARATEEERHDWRSGEGEERLAQALGLLELERIDFFLAAEALGIVAFLARNLPERRMLVQPELTPESPLDVLAPGRLGELAREALR